MPDPPGDRSSLRPTARNRMLTLDFRGHGESSHAPGTYALEHHVADVLDFCDQVVKEPVVVVGHSLGGVVALSMAQTRPGNVRGVLLEDPPLYASEREAAVAFFSILRDFTSAMQARHAPIEEYEAALAVVPSRNAQGTMADVLGPEGTRARARGQAGIDPDVSCPLWTARVWTAPGPSYPFLARSWSSAPILLCRRRSPPRTPGDSAPPIPAPR